MDQVLGSSSVWVTPQIRELIQGTLIRCTVQGCNSTFKNSGNLQMHLDKHHKIAKGPVCPKLFFCPQRDCVYNSKSATKKHFKSLKYLRQHFQKVHAEKIFKCSKCSKSFGTASMRDFHVRNCGKDFSCNECDWSYGSSEALLTHAKRKGHKQNKKTNENSHKVAIPRMRNKSLASIVLEVTNCFGSDENADGGADMDPADYAHILEIPGETEAEETSETVTDSDTVKGKETPHIDEPVESVTGGRSLNTPPPYTGDENEKPCETPEDAEVAEITKLSPSRSPERVASPSFSRVLTPPPPPVPVEARESVKALPASPHTEESQEKAKTSDPPGHKDFPQVHIPEPVIRRHYGLATPPHCPEPVDSTGYSDSLKTPQHHPASLDSTIYCPGLSTPLHRPEPVDPTSYSICLATPQHCHESDDENSNFSRDLETPPCIEADDSVHFAPVSPAKERAQYPGAGRTAVEESSKYSGGLETPPPCMEVEAPITFAPPRRLPPSPVAVETSNCIETQTESDPVCIALPPKKRLKVAITPPLNHFTEPPFCHIETQTEFDLRTGPGDPMLYTDMHTQTCHEFLTELGLSNIQTQTNWPANDMDDGIQLSNNNSKRFSSGAYDELMVSTETQTSSTQCLLESCNEEDSLSGCITQHTQTCDFLLEGLFGGGNNDLIGGFHSSLRLDCFRAENNDR